MKRSFPPLVVLLLSLSASAHEVEHAARLTCEAGTIELELMDSNILRVDVRPGGKTSPRTLVMDPSWSGRTAPEASDAPGIETIVIQSANMTASLKRSKPWTISVTDAHGQKLVEQVDPLAQAVNREMVLQHALRENLYGISGLDRLDNGGGLLRNNGAEVRAGAQGEGGAPFFFTTRYGALVDSDGGTFFTRDGVVEFNGDSRADIEYFLIAGPPLEVMSALAKLTGRPPLPPKWTLGFLNSQWGSDENEIKQLALTYRQKHIPIDAFILDYDWKAWGEDDYGEWRWNSTSGPGNENPNRFPNGASGQFADGLRAEGIKLAGILKPRILVYKKDSLTVMHAAAAEAEARGLWYPGEPPLKEYPRVRNLDFANPDTRAWFWKHLEPAFDAGMIAWWNDEADHCYPNWPEPGGTFDFNNFQFLNMGRMLYDGQRGHANVRAWSLNRNYYLGAQRYGYAEWSGDIQSGFQSMGDQRARMLATLDLGEPHWAMDIGGFVGHPSPQNYARWMEFGAFVPIYRVHGTFGEKRQPWVYGPIAEAAAARALHLRYELLPYIYSYERTAMETGVGLVRPLFWMFPDDPNVANDCSSWMFGEGLLVSPVVDPDEVSHRVYLPAGLWRDFFSGAEFQGGRAIACKVDAQTWKDIPLFVRDGSILATAPAQDYIGQHPVPEITLDVFPASKPARFTFYDDDGTTYDYERGVFYRQAICASNNGASTRLTVSEPSGAYKTELESYLVRIHGRKAHEVLLDGKPLPHMSEAALLGAEGNGWCKGQDRFGAGTVLRIPAQGAATVTLR